MHYFHEVKDKGGDISLCNWKAALLDFHCHSCAVCLTVTSQFALIITLPTRGVLQNL